MYSQVRDTQEDDFSLLDNSNTECAIEMRQAHTNDTMVPALNGQGISVRQSGEEPRPGVVSSQVAKIAAVVSIATSLSNLH